MDKKNKPSILSELLMKITKKTILDNVEKEKVNAYDIRKIYEKMELDLISSMKKALYYHQREQAKEGFNWEQWQLTKLREFETYRKRNKDIVGKYNKPIQKTIDKELRGNFNNGENRVTKLIERIKNLFSKKQEQPDITIDLPKDIAKSISMKAPEENAFFGTNEKKLEALISTVQNDLNKGSYSVLRKMDDVYRQTLFKTHVYMQNGTKTLNQAIDMATKDFLDQGINSIEYKNGARVNIASYAEMCLRTASQRATFLGEGKKRNEYGIYTVVVSAHANTCKHCAYWQGKILIDDVFSGGSAKDGAYPLLSQAIKENFLHPNCRHTLITYFPGITRLPEVPNTDKAIELYNN
ncbi:phage minor capsid protein, partial [Clostridium sp.]|uniref:phage minor capsid protein n=1 Tax=Clostridium sp. TaxID=1506 RepID=UPI002604F37D